MTEETWIRACAAAAGGALLGYAVEQWGNIPDAVFTGIWLVLAVVGAIQFFRWNVGIFLVCVVGLALVALVQGDTSSLSLMGLACAVWGYLHLVEMIADPQEPEIEVWVTVQPPAYFTEMGMTPEQIKRHRPLTPLPLDHFGAEYGKPYVFAVARGVDQANEVIQWAREAYPRFPNDPPDFYSATTKPKDRYYPCSLQCIGDGFDIPPPDLAIPGRGEGWRDIHTLAMAGLMGFFLGVSIAGWF